MWVLFVKFVMFDFCLRCYMISNFLFLFEDCMGFFRNDILFVYDGLVYDIVNRVFEVYVGLF